jgi:type II secretory ATPase GspE/PulE/Tfp pilus assembly ATPase PilB-like protein
VNIRVESIPTLYGQDATLRLFNFDESLLNLEYLGIDDDEMKEINDVIYHPRGLVLMVGPTGSGKSTTLYSMLNALNTTDRKIITLEDPIEYGLTGISQIPIDTNDGGSFAEGLRSVLRLDPDVVMVGEIRDADTAKTAIQASITGHLVLSSFHANSSAAAFARMIDLVGTNPIFANSIRLVIAQRLVRKLTDDKEAREATPAEAKYIQSVLEGVSAEKLQGIDLNHITLYEPVKTEEFPFGFNGRKAIMEQIFITEEIQAFIRGDIKDINITAIEKAARSGGMLTLEQKGVIAALRGETTLEEVSRVI